MADLGPLLLLLAAMLASTRANIFSMCAAMMGSSRLMLATEKKPLMALRRLRCTSWSMVPVMESGTEAHGHSQRSVIVSAGCSPGTRREGEALTSCPQADKWWLRGSPPAHGAQGVDEVRV